MLDAESLQQIAVAVADEIERRRRAEAWNAQVREYLLLRDRALNRQVDLPAASQANLRDLSHQWYRPPQISPDGWIGATLGSMKRETHHPHPLAAYRAQAEISQDELAQRLGISRAMVGHIENRIRKVSAEDAIAFEERLGGLVSRHALRPDIFGPAPAATAA